DEVVVLGVHAHTEAPVPVGSGWQVSIGIAAGAVLGCLVLVDRSAGIDRGVNGEADAVRVIHGYGVHAMNGPAQDAVGGHRQRRKNELGQAVVGVARFGVTPGGVHAAS